MNGLVPFHLPNKLLSFLRPSFAGRSLAERMRSTTFALFGLAAAAGLALVAIFAQPGGPLLSPAPLPSEPASSVGKAEALSASAPRLAPHSIVLSGSAVRSRGSGSHRGRAGAVGGGSGNSGVAPVTGKIAAPQSVGPQPAGGGGKNGGGEPETTTPQPAPAPAPESTSAPESVPVSSPAPTPEKTPTVHVSLPGHSGSGHSSGKNIAATVHEIVSPAPSTPPVVVPPVVPGPPASPGDNGNGHGHGHDK